MNTLQGLQFQPGSMTGSMVQWFIGTIWGTGEPINNTSPTAQHNTRRLCLHDEETRKRRRSEETRADIVAN